MNSTRNTGFFHLGRLPGEMDHLLSSFFAPVGRDNGDVSESYPSLNVWEDDANLYAEAELPGFKLDEIEIYVVKNKLSLKGQRKETQGETKEVYHRRERESLPFARTIHLPVDVDGEKVKAQLRDGLLTITLPKAPEARPRKVELTKP
jgi:HSP20 family protein